MVGDSLALFLSNTAIAGIHRRHAEPQLLSRQVPTYQEF